MSDVEEQDAVTDDRAREARIAEARRCRILVTADERRIVRRWWQRLALAEHDARQAGVAPWPRGLRATLRRAQGPDGVIFTEAFRKLWLALESQVPEPRYRRDIEAWACVAAVLAELRHDKPGQGLASQLGREKENTGKPIMSELRFQQLQQSRTPEELVRRLRRALALIRGEGVSTVRLADDVLHWFAERDGHRFERTEDRLAFQWATEYFTTLSRYQKNDL